MSLFQDCWVPESERPKKEALQKGSVLFEISLSVDVPKGQPSLVGFRGAENRLPLTFILMIQSFWSLFAGFYSFVSMALPLWGV